MHSMHQMRWHIIGTKYNSSHCFYPLSLFYSTHYHIQNKLLRSCTAVYTADFSLMFVFLEHLYFTLFVLGRGCIFIFNIYQSSIKSSETLEMDSWIYKVHLWTKRVELQHLIVNQFLQWLILKNLSSVPRGPCRLVTVSFSLNDLSPCPHLLFRK